MSENNGALGEGQNVYVDWEKVVVVFKIKGIDLGPYQGSEISYISKNADIPWSTVKRIKTERSTKLSTIGRIAHALDCNPLDLITTEGYPEPFSRAPVAA